MGKKKFGLAARSAIVMSLVVWTTPMLHAADLDDSIESELDSSMSDESPKPDTSAAQPAPSAPENSTQEAKAPSANGDDLQLDFGDSPEKTTEAEPSKKDEAPSTAEQAPAPEPSPQDATPAQPPVVEAPPAAPQPAPVVDDKPLDLDEPAPVVEDQQAPPAAPVVAEPPAPAPAPAPVATHASIHIDPPNKDLEKKFYKRSVGYHPVSDASWDDVVGGRKSETYHMQSGDTLWDLSQTFFGDGAYWAKLWSQNGRIENPHAVEKGQVVRFASGTESEGPAFGLSGLDGRTDVLSLNVKTDIAGEPPQYREQVEADITQAEIDAGNIIENAEVIPAPELPEARRRPPVLQNLPSSFRESKVSLLDEYDPRGFSVDQRGQSKLPAQSLLTSIYLDRAPISVGTVQEIEFQDRMASTGAGLLVHLNGPLNPGSRLTSIRIKQKLGHGVVGEFGGIISIDYPISEKKNIYHATVIDSPNPVVPGSLLIQEPPPLVVHSSQGRRTEHELKILGGELDENRLLFSEGSIIYLNGGSQEGVHAGDIVGVRALRRTLKSDTEFPNYERPAAVLRIVDSRDHVCTALVTNSYEEIRVGDMTGGELPSPRADLEIESPSDLVQRGFSAAQSKSEKPAQDAAPSAPEQAPAQESTPPAKSDELDLDDSSAM